MCVCLNRPGFIVISSTSLWDQVSVIFVGSRTLLALSVFSFLLKSLFHCASCDLKIPRGYSLDGGEEPIGVYQPCCTDPDGTEVKRIPD